MAPTSDDLEPLLQHIRRYFSHDNHPPSPIAYQLGQQLATFAPDDRIRKLFWNDEKTCNPSIRSAFWEALVVGPDSKFLVDWCAIDNNSDDNVAATALARYCVLYNPLAVLPVLQSTPSIERQSQIIDSLLRVALSSDQSNITMNTKMRLRGVAPVIAWGCANQHHADDPLHVLTVRQWMDHTMALSSSANNDDDHNYLDPIWQEDWIDWEWTMFEYCCSNNRPMLPDADVEWLVDLLYRSTPWRATKVVAAMARYLEQVPSHQHEKLWAVAVTEVEEKETEVVGVPRTVDVWRLCSHCCTTLSTTCRIRALSFLRLVAREAKPLARYWVRLSAETMTCYGGECADLGQTLLDEYPPPSIDTAHLTAFSGISLDRLNIGSELTPLEQSAALLFSMAAFETGDSSLLKEELSPKYNHLGCVLVPLLLRRLEHGPTLPAFDVLLNSAIVTHPVAAQQVWSTVQPWFDASSSLCLILLRRIPRMIQRNSRLYNRCIAQIGQRLRSSHDLEMRVAAAASLAECAQLDVIADVSDVIGWIQELLGEANELLVYYALATLQALVEVEELEWTVVVTVVHQKLCPLDSLLSLRKLPDIVLEALALLLGVGGEEDNLSSTSVSRAVRALLSLGQQISYLPTDQDNSRLHHALVQALSQFPLEAMGVDDSSIQQALGDTQKSNSYTELSAFVMESIERLTDRTHATVLASKILVLEEEVIGPALWQRRKQSAGSPSEPYRRILPQPEEIRTMMQPAANPIAILALADGNQLAVLRDNADACLEESSDPHMLMLCSDAFLAFAQKVVAGRDSIGDVVTEITSWYEVFLSPDAMYLSLASISVCISLSESTDLDAAEKTHKSVMEAFTNEDFENMEIGKVCLGFIGISSFHRGCMDDVESILSTLEECVRGYGGEQSFGAYYAIGIIAKACIAKVRTEKQTESRNEIYRSGAFVCRANSFLLEQLLTCFEDHRDGTRLVEAVKSGKVSGDLVNDLQQLDSNSLPLLVTKHVTARHIFMSFSLSSAALSRVNGHLMMLVFRYFESLEWGTGKGLAIPSIVHACNSSGVLDDEILEQVYLDFVTAFEHQFHSSSSAEERDSLEDIASAIKGLDWIVPSVKRYQLPVDVFDDDTDTFLFLTSLSTSLSLPLLGSSLWDKGHPMLETEEVTKAILDAARNKTMLRTSSAATIALSLLACVEANGRLQVNSGTEKNGETEQDDEVRVEHSIVNFEKLSDSQEGSLTSLILKRIERSFQNDTHVDVVNKFSPILQSISIPDKYATGFIAPLLSLRYLRSSQVELLCSQVVTRRPAFSPGPSYISMVSELCRASSADWAQWEDKQKTTLLKCFGDFGGRILVKNGETILEELWKLCRSVSMHAILFLDSTHKILRSSLSPRCIGQARRLLLTTVARDILASTVDEVFQETEQTTILGAFSTCMREIPLQDIEQSSLLRLDLGASEQIETECCRALILLDMIGANQFKDIGRHHRELGTVSAFLSQLILKHPNQASLIRRLICRFSVMVDLSHKTLDALYELMLLAESPSCALSFEWFATSSYFLASKLQTQNRRLALGTLLVDGQSVRAHALPQDELDRFIEQQVELLPQTLHRYCEHSNSAAVAVNNLYRIRERWGAEPANERIIQVIEHAIQLCQQKRNESYVHLVISKSGTILA